MDTKLDPLAADKSFFAALLSASIDSLDDLLTELEVLNHTWLGSVGKERGSIYYQRVARIYDYRKDVPTILVLKPDAYRYWTRSVALHDADEVAEDFARWNAAAKA